MALNKAADLDLTYVPFSGTAAATPALLGGQVDALMTYNTEALDLIDQGAKMLGVASEERLPNLPDVPTFKEQGFAVVQGASRGVAVPPETPAEIRPRSRTPSRRSTRCPRCRLVKSADSSGPMFSMVLWDEVFARVAADYPDVEHDSCLVDAMAARRRDDRGDYLGDHRQPEMT